MHKEVCQYSYCVSQSEHQNNAQAIKHLEIRELTMERWRHVFPVR